MAAIRDTSTTPMSGLQLNSKCHPGVSNPFHSDTNSTLKSKLVRLQRRLAPSVSDQSQVSAAAPQRCAKAILDGPMDFQGSSQQHLD